VTREGASPPPLLLDPFAFPSETKGRFRMLLAAALALAWSLGSHLVAVPRAPIIPADISPETREVLDRMIARETDPLTPEERSKARELFRSYVPMMEYNLLKLVLSVFLLFAIVAGTVFLYLRQPGRLRRRYGARRLTPEESPRVTADLERLALRIGLPRVPWWEYRPGFSDGLALGPRGREVVVISGSPKLLEATWSDVHRAVVLHELAHFVNGDVRIREISWSLWRTLVWTVAVLGCGIAVVSLATGELRVPLFGESSRTFWDFFGTAGKTALILLGAGWIWAELIRVREFYADWRVATWGFLESLRQRLRLTSSYSPPWRSSRLSRALRHHPSNERRLEVLEDPRELFRVTPELAFLSGFLLALVFGQLAPLVDDFVFVAMIFVGPLFLFLGPFAFLFPLALAVLATSMIAHWITGALGVQVQRETVADLAENVGGGRGYLRLGKAALLLALGLETGLLLTPWGGPIATLEVPLWVVGSTFLLWLWLGYQRRMASLWLGSRPSPGRAGTFLAWIAAVLLAALLGSALALRVAVRMAGDPDFFLAPISADHPLYPSFMAGLLAIAGAIFILASGASLLFMLSTSLGSAAWLRRRPRGTASKEETV